VLSLAECLAREVGYDPKREGGVDDLIAYKDALARSST
jgi:hypothetical protein